MWFVVKERGVLAGHAGGDRLRGCQEMAGKSWVSAWFEKKNGGESRRGRRLLTVRRGRREEEEDGDGVGLG